MKTTPNSADLYALVVVVSDDLGSDANLRSRIAEISTRGFPVVPIVPSCTTYDFKNAPLLTISERNALGFDDPDKIIAALLHHGGLRRHGTGGQVMISYARRDGATLALALRVKLQEAGFHCFVDEYEIVGGAPVQRDIEDAIRRSDLVLLVDSQAAATSQWVEDEMDMARAAHVPVIAVTSTDAGFHHALRCPHVPWEPSDDVNTVAERAANRARRLLASKIAFSDRVWRVLDQICRFRGWVLDGSFGHGRVLVRPGDQQILVACSDGPADVIAVDLLRRAVGDSGQGLFVGGTRPYPRPLAAGLTRAGAPSVRVTPLSRVATRVTGGITLSPLAGQRIFLSAATPDDPTQAEATAVALPSFVITFVQTMFELGATVVYGGHPSVTRMMYKSVIELVAEDSGHVELHQGRFWMSKNEVPVQVKDRKVFNDVHWHGHGHGPVEDLAILRDEMIQPSLDAAVFVGGVVGNPVGGRAGVIVEYERFRTVCPERPAFVLGLGGGAAGILLAQGEPPGVLVDTIIARELASTSDPDLATALIVAELLDRKHL